MVDMALTDDPTTILKSLAALPSNPTEEAYQNFLRKNFSLVPKTPSCCEPDHHHGETATRTIPRDYQDTVPAYLQVLPNRPTTLTSFVLDLKQRWCTLCRVFNQRSSRTSLISLPHPFFVPGGRFRECYYWDTLWTVKGLLACDMLTSAQSAVRNLLHMVRTFGFVPNGNRVYYLNRSQPPILTEAVRLIYDHLPTSRQQIEWLEEAVPLLHAELRLFHTTHAISAVSPFSQYHHLTLSVYVSNSPHPRPESYTEDVITAKQASTDIPAETVYQNLAAGAESGWDFSSRWFPGPGERLHDIRVMEIIPCCLNTFLLHAERTLMQFHCKLADAQIHRDDHLKLANFYNDVATKRERDMMKMLWRVDKGCWYDFDMRSGKATDIISCAGIMPAWASQLTSWGEADAKKFVNFVKRTSGLLQAGGMASTSNKSGEQWDYPNCWAPLVDLVISSLESIAQKFPSSGADKLAKEIATRFVRTVFRGWLREGVVHEKYDCTSDDGVRGVGGEYEPQTGFGWTNGTVLSLLQKYLAVDTSFWDDVCSKA